MKKLPGGTEENVFPPQGGAMSFSRFKRSKIRNTFTDPTLSPKLKAGMLPNFSTRPFHLKNLPCPTNVWIKPVTFCSLLFCESSAESPPHTHTECAHFSSLFMSHLYINGTLFYAIKANELKAPSMKMSTIKESRGRTHKNGKASIHSSPTENASIKQVSPHKCKTMFSNNHWHSLDIIQSPVTAGLQLTKISSPWKVNTRALDPIQIPSSPKPHPFRPHLPRISKYFPAQNWQF